MEEARSALLETIASAASAPPTERELQRAKDDILKGWDTTMRNSENAAIELSEWIGVGDWRLIFLHRDRVEAVTAADVTRVAQAYLTENNRTVGVFEPTDAAQRVEIPSPPNIAALTKFYKGREAMAQGEAFDTTPAAVEARLERSKLPAGADVTLLPKKTRGATVNVAMTLRLGNETALQNRSTAGDLVPAMLTRGTAKRTREEISEELDRLKTQLGIAGGSAQVVVNLETTRPNLEAALRLAAEVLRQPSFPATEFELLRQEQLAGLEDAKADPQQKAFTAYQRHLNPWPKGDPRYAETIEESIAAAQGAKLDDAKAFHRDFYGASAGEIAVVGDFDKAEVSALLAELFGDWKSATAFERLSNPYRDQPALVQKIEAPDKEQAFLIAGMNLAARDTDPDYPAMILANFMTGGGFLNSRLATRLRQKEGFSYGTGSQFQASAFEKSGAFLAYAIYAPQNGDKLEAAMKEEIQKVIDSGFTEQEIAEAKQGWLQQRQVSRGVDRELARTLATRDYQDRTLAFDADLEAKVAKLTAAEIQAAVKKHLAVGEMTFIQSGDFAKAAKTAAGGS
jgi:zinc protease